MLRKIAKEVIVHYLRRWWWTEVWETMQGWFLMRKLGSSVLVSSKRHSDWIRKKRPILPEFSHRMSLWSVLHWKPEFWKSDPSSKPFFKFWRVLTFFKAMAKELVRTETWGSRLREQQIDEAIFNPEKPSFSSPPFTIADSRKPAPPGAASSPTLQALPHVPFNSPVL